MRPSPAPTSGPPPGCWPQPSTSWPLTWRSWAWPPTTRVDRLSRARWPPCVTSPSSRQGGRTQPAETLEILKPPRRKPVETWWLADIGLSADELRGAALTRVTEARPPEAKAPTERIENVAADEAASRVADWLAARKLI